MSHLKPAAILALAFLKSQADHPNGNGSGSVSAIRRTISVLGDCAPNVIGLIQDLENLGLVESLVLGRSDASSTTKITEAGKVALVLGTV